MGIAKKNSRIYVAGGNADGKASARPMLKEMSEEFIWFVSGDQVDNYPTIPIKEQLGPVYNTYIKFHKAKYGSFEEFLAAAGIK